MEFLKKYNLASRFSIILAILLAVFLFGLEVASSQKIIFGVKIAAKSFGGLNKEQASQTLEDLAKKFEERGLFFELQEKNFSEKFNLSDLGITINKEGTLEEALGVGKDGNFFAKSKEKFFSLLLKKNVPVTYGIGEEKFQDFFEKNLEKFDDSAKNAALIFDLEKKEFLAVPEKSGRIIDREKLNREISRRISLLDNSPIEITMINDIPEVTVDEVERAREKAQEIFDGGPYYLNYEEKKISIETDGLLSFFKFLPVIGDLSGNKILGIRPNEETIKAYLTGLSPGINQEPVDAQFTLKDGRVTAFALSRDGARLDIEKTASLLSQNIWQKIPETEIIVEKNPPKITEGDIENLGITGLIGKGISNFSGSPKNRIHNIKVGTAKFQGILIKPGEEFSFNKILGEIGPQTGYLPELVIKRDKTIPEYGGGLCQVSTTMFRAAINAGLEIIERFPHAFPVKYYSPQGFDATIYPPSPDLKFKNNTGNHILIQTRIEGQNLTFEFYGKDDGRNIVIGGPFEYDKKPDGSMKAKLTQKVYDKEETLIIDKAFYSNYRSPLLYPVERNPLE